MWSYVLVFLLYAALDALYAYYTVVCAAGRPVKAAISAAFIYAMGAYGLKLFVTNGWYVIPIVLGAMLGTYVTVKWMGTK